VNLNFDEIIKERNQLICEIKETFDAKKKSLSRGSEFYKIYHELGKGAFSKVLLGMELLTGKLVALKVIDKSILTNE
jgi:MAP/microtubule affinity-regulating kinase